MNYVDACQGECWHLRLFPNGDGSEVLAVPYKCHSWRHSGPCRCWKGAQDFVRIKEALEGESHWAYLVLTFDPKRSGKPFEQYKAGVVCWGRLLKRLTRAYGLCKYIQTWERFRKGGVHVNVILYNSTLIQIISQNWRAWRKDWLNPAAIACGFGQRTWVEVKAGNAQLAGYLAKLAKELTGSGKDYQIPVDAPPHFRRIRASRHTLPPVMSTGMRGTLIQSPLPKESPGQSK